MLEGRQMVLQDGLAKQGVDSPSNLIVFSMQFVFSCGIILLYHSVFL